MKIVDVLKIRDEGTTVRNMIPQNTQSTAGDFNHRLLFLRGAEWGGESGIPISGDNEMEEG